MCNISAVWWCCIFSVEIFAVIFEEFIFTSFHSRAQEYDMRMKSKLVEGRNSCWRRERIFVPCETTLAVPSRSHHVGPTGENSTTCTAASSLIHAPVIIALFFFTILSCFCISSESAFVFYVRNWARWLSSCLKNRLLYFVYWKNLSFRLAWAKSMYVSML